MPYLESSRRVGRSQAASIFWGLVSVFFAAAACYYFWKDHENETSANVFRDQVLTLQEQRETLNSQKDKLQSSIIETENQLKTREEFLQEKETKLADEESQIEAAGQQNQNQSQQSQAQAALVKKFNDTVRKLVKDDDTDVVLRGGRPVLRVPDSVFFAFGDATLKPEGKTLLNQISQSLNGQLDTFELRIETFTDSDGEGARSGDADKTVTPVKLDATDTKPDAAAKTAPPSPAKTAHFATGWDLTGARAAALAKFLHDQGSLPFQNIVVVPRGDFQPIVSSGKEGHARNRRVEITIAPAAPSFHPADPGKSGGVATGSTSPSTPASAKNSDKPKAAKKGD